MLPTILQTVLYLSLLIHVLLLVICVWRVWRGENVIDRLIGFDMVSTLILAGLVIAAIIQGRSLFLDVALAVAALSFIGQVALSKYVADEQMF
ncbi:MAG: hypothetical protein KDD89_07730 [Anaerolineales bacterium]|nr:hypothetical protein [Anaerolineales bacterium]